jgi:metal-responsive CopG/Arc/MetJ family transcriptional regulator
MSKKKMIEKVKTGITVNTDLLKIMDEHLENIGNMNRSKYIEKLITEDLIKRGKEIKKEF